MTDNDNNNRELRKRWTEKELNSLRSQLYSLDHIKGFKTIQLKRETDEAIEELCSRHLGEKRTYDEIILLLIDTFKKLNIELILRPPEPEPSFEEE